FVYLSPLTRPYSFLLYSSPPHRPLHSFPTRRSSDLATLPHPRTSNPTFQPDRMLARRDLILARYHGVEVYIPPAEETDTLQLPAITVPPVESLQVEVPTPGDTASDTTAARKDSL